jgi:DnaK suppressor protein
MATAVGDDIDVLVKARRSLAGDYVPSEDEAYMSELNWITSGVCCSSGRS